MTIRPVAASAILLTFLLSGCSLAAQSPHSDRRTTPSDGASRTTSPTPATTVAEPVAIHGSGPQTITVLVPEGHPRYFQVTFGCSSGAFNVVLQEDKHVYENGNECEGEGNGYYQMPIPDVSVLHFAITVDSGETFDLGGHFCRATC